MSLTPPTSRISFYSLMLSLMVLTSCQSPDSSSRLDPDIRPQDIRAHIEYLASDDMKGRAAGSPQEAMAANYLSDWFEHFGLAPAGEDDTFIQEFKITKGVKNAPGGSYLQYIDEHYSTFNDMVQPWGQSANGRVDGPLVFAGYGIEAPELNYNDFQNVDLDGKIALILKYGPTGNANPHDDFGSYWSIERKVEAAYDHGATGVVLAKGPLQVTAETDTLDPLQFESMKAESQIPVLQIRSELASHLMKSAGQNLSDLQQTIDRERTPQSLDLGIDVSLYVQLIEDERIARNVAGWIQGTEHPDRYIVIGAHYDHLGMGGSGSLDGSGKPKIHNGADDNASGTAGLLELAHYYMTHPPKTSLLFLGFSGEELGLLGSNYYVNHPTVSLDNVEAMINMDMIGRLNENLIIFGVGTSNGWNAVLDSADTDFSHEFSIERVPDGSGASDHTSFYQKEIPVLHYFTDTHADYHRPSDDPQYINYEGEDQVLEHLRYVVDELSHIPDSAFYYTKAEETRRQDMKLSGPTLGVLPDYGFKGEGLRITGVSAGGPAEGGGLQGGDIIVGLNGQEVRDIYDYMGVLNTLSQGQTISVRVNREGDVLQLEVTL
jgi:aminopeptidase YwaD